MIYKPKQMDETLFTTASYLVHRVQNLEKYSHSSYMTGWCIKRMDLIGLDFRVTVVARALKALFEWIHR